MKALNDNPNDRIEIAYNNYSLDDLVLLNPFGNEDFGKNATDTEFKKIVKAAFQALNPALTLYEMLGHNSITRESTAVLTNRS